MPVAMMEVWGVRVVVLARFVAMPVCMWAAGLSRGRRVVVMLVMHVNVKMLDRLVRVAMAVRLAEETPDSDGYQRGGEAQAGRGRLGEHTNGRNRTDERRSRKVRTCA
jgi:hypothetical protein